MSTPKSKARKNGKARKAAQLYAYPYEDGHIVTDVPPIAEELKAGWCKRVAMFDLNESADAERIEAGARAAYAEQLRTCVVDRARVIKWNELPPFVKELWREQSRAVLLSIGALSAEKGAKR